jgi:hypothetical protein
MTAARLGQGFLAGFLAVLLFHQTALLLIHLATGLGSAPWRLTPVPPLGVPAVLSGAFWGGLWGVAFAVLLAPRLGSGTAGYRYWLGAFLFGAVILTLVAWFVVQPLKGLPVGGGFLWPGIVIGPLVNGVWGIGTALLLRLASRAHIRTA